MDSSVQPELLETAIAVALIGLVVGSFLATLVVRLPEGRSILVGRSHCEGCAALLRPWQLIPVFGWLWQKGRCRFCGSPISPLYLVMECGASAIGLWALFAVPATIAVPTIGLGWLLLTLAVMDWRYLILSDWLTLPLLGLGLVVTWIFWPLTFIDHVLGMAAGAVVLAVIAQIYRRLRHRDGLGFGDVKLAGAIGAWLGWQGLPSVFIVASGSALLVLFVQRALGTKIGWDLKVAFGSYLCWGTWIVWLYGPIVWG